MLSPNHKANQQVIIFVFFPPPLRGRFFSCSLPPCGGGFFSCSLPPCGGGLGWGESLCKHSPPILTLPRKGGGNSSGRPWWSCRWARCAAARLERVAATAKSL